MNFIKKLFKKNKEFKALKNGTVIYNPIYIPNNLKTAFFSICDYYSEFNQNELRDRLEDNEFLDDICKNTNFVCIYELDKSLVNDLLEILVTNRYLYSNIVDNNKNNTYKLLLAGSVLGYKEIIRNSINQDTNSLLKSIKESMYHLDKELFSDFILDDILDESLFTQVYPEFDFKKKINEEEDYIIYNIDNFDIIYKRLSEYKFTLEDAKRCTFCSIEILNKEFEDYYKQFTTDLFKDGSNYITASLEDIAVFLQRINQSYQESGFSSSLLHDISTISGASFKNILVPYYKKIELNLEEEYNEKTEIPMSDIKETYDVIPDINELIREDEDGNLIYDSKDFI